MDKTQECFDCSNKCVICGTYYPCEAAKEEMKKNECEKCDMSMKDPLFWDSHQTMPDNNIWCVRGK